MRKKELFAKINSLIDSLNSLQNQLKVSRQENAELKTKIAELNLKIEELSSVKVQAPTPAELKTTDSGFTVNVEAASEEPKTEEPAPATTPEPPVKETAEEVVKETEEVVLPDEMMEYGSVAIGKIVQESVKYTNIISASDNEHTKELLNLIMGKGEIAKTEIFSIIEGQTAPEIKRQLIDGMVAETTDYFISVAGQL